MTKRKAFAGSANAFFMAGIKIGPEVFPIHPVSPQKRSGLAESVPVKSCRRRLFSILQWDSRNFRLSRRKDNGRRPVFLRAEFVRTMPPRH
ncbi:hypothetical protein D3C83_94050 [compost metagenome]